MATDHPWLLSIIAGACASAGANIVDAQIYTTTDGRALDTIAISREYDRDEDEGRRATRIGEMIEDVLEGKLRLPEAMARRSVGRGKVRPFVVEPEVTINNQWSDRYTVIEVSGLDRPGLLYQLTTAISKLNLNIASAHVATFGERARDVFYVTDLLGAQINAPTRQAAIKSALIHLLANDEAAAAEQRGLPLRALSRRHDRLRHNSESPLHRNSLRGSTSPRKRGREPDSAYAIYSRSCSRMW